MSDNQVTRFRLIELLVLHETPALDRLRTTYSTSLNDCLYVFAVKYGRNPDYQLHRGYDDDLCCNFICRKGDENDTRNPAIIELPDGTIRLFKRRERAAGAIRGINNDRQSLIDVVESAWKKERVSSILRQTAEEDKRRFEQRRREFHQRLSRQSLRPGCRAANRIYQSNLQHVGK